MIKLLNVLASMVMVWILFYCLGVLMDPQVHLFIREVMSR